MRVKIEPYPDAYVHGVACYLYKKGHFVGNKCTVEEIVPGADIVVVSSWFGGCIACDGRKLLSDP